MNSAAAFLASVTAAFLNIAGAPANAAGSLLIENVTLLSPEQAQPLGNRYVLIRDGRIAEVSDRAIFAAGVPRLDGAGKYLTPGLTDAHVHVSDAIGLPHGSQDPQLATLAEDFFVQQPRSYLYFGVTQVLDTANFPERVAQFAAQPRHPDIYRCGAAPIVDGYPLVFVDKAIRHQVFRDFIFEPANARDHPMPAGIDPAAHTPEAVVERIAASGAICVKTSLEDGFGDQNDWPIMSRETLERVRKAARKHGLFLAVHANAVDMQRIAVEGNVDLLLHGIWQWNALNDREGIPPEIAAHLRSVRDKRIGYQATLRVLPGVTDLLDPHLLDDPVYPKVVPPALLTWYRSDAAQWFKRQAFGADVDAAAVLAAVRRGSERWATSERGMRALRYLYEQGQPMLLGSDTPSAPTYGNQPGYDTFKEMKLMAQAGIPLAAIFQAGTVNNARQLGLARDYGTIEKGKVANLLLLDANPLADVDAWARIDRVILHGEPIDRETLAADSAR
jgi:imidazolonepropionase-like amidohydrolase